MSLRARALLGLYWVGGTRLVGQVLTWAITIVVIRILSPGDYGILAMAMVFMGLLTLVAEAGLGSTLVQLPELDDLTLRRTFGAVILIDLALFALQFAAAPLVARFFEEERLIAIIRVLALQFLLMIFTVIPGALLSRKLDFKQQSMIGLAASICGSLTSLALALSGFGVWALVISSLVVSFVNAVALNIVVPSLHWPDFSFKGMRRLIVFGGEITAARVLYFVYSQSDIFIGGRLLGKELLGFYSISLHLASLPVQKISSVVNQIAFPAFAEAQRDPDSVPRHMIKGIRILSFFALPVLWGVASIAPEIVRVLLGPKWDAAVVPLQLLPLVMPVTILGPFLNAAFQGIGRSRVVLMNTLTASLILPAAFWIGAHWGLVGMSMAWVIGFPVVFLVNLQRMLPLVQLKVGDVLRAAMRPALSGAGMYACVHAARAMIGGVLPAPLSMATLIAAGAVSYVILTLATNRRGAQEVVDLFRQRRIEGANA